MKIAKTLVIAVVASSALFFSSCNKETECVCVTTTTDANGNSSSEEEIVTSPDGDCPAFETSFELFGITTTTTCNYMKGKMKIFPFFIHAY